MKLEEMIKKAADMIAINKERKFVKVHIKAIENTFEFKTLTQSEASEILQTCNDDDFLFMKRYIYNSCDELRKLAIPLFDSGKIADYADVVELLSESDRIKLFSALKELRYEDEGQSEIEVQELKN